MTKKCSRWHFHCSPERPARWSASARPRCARWRSCGRSCRRGCDTVWSRCRSTSCHASPPRAQSMRRSCPPSASVCHNHERLRFDYSTHDGTQSRREVEPYRLVRSGVRWYLVAWDLAREDWRSFRVDRMEPKIPTGPRFVPRELPAGGAADFVSRGVARAYSSTRATVLLHAPIEQIAPMVSEQWGSVEPTDEGRCVIVLSGTSLRSIAHWLRAFDVDFTVVNPPELREECRTIAAETAVATQRYLDA